MKRLYILFPLLLISAALLDAAASSSTAAPCPEYEEVFEDNEALNTWIEDGNTQYGRPEDEICPSDDFDPLSAHLPIASAPYQDEVDQKIGSSKAPLTDIKSDERRHLKKNGEKGRKKKVKSLNETLKGPWLPLHAAIRNGNKEKFDQFINPDMANTIMEDKAGDKWTPIHIAALLRENEYTQKLIENGADVNFPAECGITPLHLAAQHGHVSCIEHLLQAEDIDPNKQSGPHPSSTLSECRPLYTAIARGYPACTEKLIQAPQTKLNEPLCRGYPNTAVEIAVMCEQAGILNMLIQAGAAWDTQNFLNYVGRYEDLAVIEVLIKNGMDINQLLGGKTPLHIAAKKGNFNYLNQFLKNGADPNVRNSRTKIPLHYAVAKKGNQFYACTKRLIEAGSNLYATSEMGETPLDFAAAFGSTSTLKLLLQYDNDEKATSSQGSTPLHHAASYKNHENIRCLLDHGADPNARTFKSNYTPLHHAVMAGSRPCVLALMKHPDLNIHAADITELEKTPLMSGLQELYTDLTMLSIPGHSAPKKTIGRTEKRIKICNLLLGPTLSTQTEQEKLKAKLPKLEAALKKKSDHPTGEHKDRWKEVIDSIKNSNPQSVSHQKTSKRFRNWLADR